MAGSYRRTNASGYEGNVVAMVVHQVGHGLSINNPVKLSAGTYAKAKADSAANAEVVGIVSQVYGADDFTLLTEGRFTSTAHGLTVDAVYFLSAASAGALTATEPTTAGQISKPLVYVIDTNTLYFHNWRGVVVGSAPGIHHTTHESGGSDAIKLDDLAAPDDNTDLNVSTSKHGLCPKAPNDTSKYLRGDGTWAAVSGGATLKWVTQTFTSSGTWTKPANFTGNCVFVSGVGGGGAGGGTGYANNNKYCGGGGGSGCWKENAAYDVSAVSTVAVTIGAGGTGADEDAGGDGTASSFGTLSFPAGKGGQPGNSNKNWGQGGPGGQPGNNGLFIAYYSTPTRYAQGGNGGSTPWGVGGLGATTAGNGNAASANTGGGGGGAYGNDSTTRTGGNGGSGIIVVTWQETV